MKNDDLFNYLVATDELDEFLGYKNKILTNKIMDLCQVLGHIFLHNLNH